jgi:hypothetical protein
VADPHRRDGSDARRSAVTLPNKTMPKMIPIDWMVFRSEQWKRVFAAIFGEVAYDNGYRH